MGFASSDLVAKAVEQDFILAKCIYEPEQKTIIIREVIQSYLNEYHQLDPATRNEQVEQSGLFQRFCNSVNEIGMLLKDEGFEEEQEWRLISSALKSRDQLQWRAGSSGVIPYCCFSMQQDGEIPSGLRKVIVGPSPQQTDEPTMRLRLAFPRHAVHVCLSRIPYRPWM